MVFSTSPMRLRNRRMKPVKGSSASAASMNGMPRPAE